MMKRRTRHLNQTSRLMAYRQRRRLPLVLFGLATGLLSGLVACLYRLVIDRATAVSLQVYQYLGRHPLWIGLWLAVLLGLAALVRLLMRWEPLSRGSGIPQVEAELKGQLHMNWWRVLLTKFVGGVLCMAAGFSLGREGPSIQLGGAAGKGIRRLFRRPEGEEKYLITGGASAGLAAAFNAPLSGVIFSLEEVHGHFSPAVLLTAMTAAIAADVVSKLAFGGAAVLQFRELPVLPMRWMAPLVLMGVVLGAGGALFNAAILKSQDLYTRLPERVRLAVPFLASGVVGLLLPAALGGGNSVIVSLSSGNTAISLLLLLLAVRFVFTMVCFGSGAPGGIFLPLLAIGALIGALTGEGLVTLAGLDAAFVPTFVALAMAGYFAAVVRAPVTGILLITEMTGSFSHLLSLACVALVAYLTAQMMGSKPVYESLRERLLKKQDVEGGELGKEIIETAVYLDSMLDGKRVRDVHWPERSLLVGIRRGSEELIPHGDTVMESGDFLVLLTDASRAAPVRRAVTKMAQRTRA